jgi:LysM repeat protein
LNVIVSLSVAVIIISVNSRKNGEDDTPINERPVDVKIVTATPPPGGEGLQPADYLSTISAWELTTTQLAQQEPLVVVVTSTPNAEEEQGVVPGVDVPAPTIATLNPSLLPPIPTDGPTSDGSEVASLNQPETTTETEDDGCIRHTVQSGDYVGTIATQYGVSEGDIFQANGIDAATILQIGDVLIIPGEGCGALNTPTAIPSPTRTPFELSTTAPTITLAPTTENAQVAISTVAGAGDVNTEAVTLRNEGDTINLNSWTLTSNRGETFRFPEIRMYAGSLLLVYSKQGLNTPAALYWGRDRAAWRMGDVLTLTDAAGEVQATFTVQ